MARRSIQSSFLIPQVACIFVLLSLSHHVVPVLGITNELSSSTSNIANVSSNNNNKNSSNSGGNSDVKAYSIPLPRVLLQFICDHDIRSTFNETKIFEEFYQEVLLPYHIRLNVLSNAPTYKSEVKMSGMKDISPTKWYYSSCNISSPQVLITMELEGWAEFSSSPPMGKNTDAFGGNGSGKTYGNSNETIFVDWIKQELYEQVTPDTIEYYFAENVCQNMDFYKAFVDDDWSSSASKSAAATAAGLKGSYNDWEKQEDDRLDHSLFLLCGGEDVVYYEQEEPDGSFIVLGFMVGVVMVMMIFTELQKFENSTSRSRRRSTTTTTSRRDYEQTHIHEFEMV